MSAKLISIEEARSRVLNEALPLPPHTVPLIDALGAVLAEDIIAAHDVPPFDNSGMDGYAVRAVDIVEATPAAPARLLITETIAAGHVATAPLAPGQAARIMTGAPVLEGADTVVQSELTTEDDGYVNILEPVKPGKNIRRAGEDISAGERVLAAGTALGPAEIGILASLGHPQLSVHMRPRVAIISTGSELVEVDQPLGPGQIRNSNSYTLRSLCTQMGVEAHAFGIVPDD